MTHRHCERSLFLSAVEQDVTKLIRDETPSLAARCLSSSRYSTFSRSRLSYPPERQITSKHLMSKAVVLPFKHV